jgi:hypothetical protein
MVVFLFQLGVFVCGFNQRQVGLLVADGVETVAQTLISFFRLLSWWFNLLRKGRYQTIVCAVASVVGSYLSKRRDRITIGVINYNNLNIIILPPEWGNVHFCEACRPLSTFSSSKSLFWLILNKMIPDRGERDGENRRRRTAYY